MGAAGSGLRCILMILSPFGKGAMNGGHIAVQPEGCNMALSRKREKKVLDIRPEAVSARLFRLIHLGKLVLSNLDENKSTLFLILLIRRLSRVGRGLFAVLEVT